MPRKKGLTDREANEALQKLDFDYRSRKREHRVLANRARNLNLERTLSKKVLTAVHEALRNDENKKYIARRYGLPHSFIMYLWRKNAKT